MRLSNFVPLILALILCVAGGVAHAKPKTVSLFTEAVMTGDVEVLDKLLAPNYWHIGGNGHIMDKEHFLASIKDKKLVLNRLTLTNVRETKLGDATLLTGNGVSAGEATPALPAGNKRFTVVLVKDGNAEKVVLFQSTPVISSDDCKDGNCLIK